jgi:hypothetical protein
MPVFALEVKSCFGACLCRELLAVDFSVVKANRPDRFIRRRREKHDSIDAEIAAKPFLAGTTMSIPNNGAEHINLIRMLKVIKDSAIERRTKAIDQIQALLVMVPAALQ